MPACLSLELHHGPFSFLTKAYLLYGYILSSEHAHMGASEIRAGLVCKYRMRSECQQLKWGHECQGLIGPRAASGEMEFRGAIYCLGKESKTRYRRGETCNVLCMCCLMVAPHNWLPCQHKWKQDWGRRSSMQVNKEMLSVTKAECFSMCAHEGEVIEMFYCGVVQSG